MIKLTEKQVDYLLKNPIHLSENVLDFLCESRIDFIKQKYRNNINTSHDVDSSNRSTDDIIDHIAKNIDQTKNKEYTQHLVNLYNKGHFKLSDAKSIKKMLGIYHSAKSMLENNSFNTIKSIDMLKDVVATAIPKLDKKAKHDSENTPMTMKTVFSMDGAEGYHVPNKATSIKNYGPNGILAKTIWCTASEGRQNMFNGYRGKNYVLHLPNNEVLQLNHNASELRDYENKEIKFSNNRFNPYEHIIRSFVTETAKLDNKYNEQSTLLKSHGYAPLHDIMDVIHRYGVTSPQTEYSMKTDNITDQTFDILKQHGAYLPRLGDNPTLKPHHIQQILDSKYSIGSMIAPQSIATNPNMTPELHHQIIDKMFDENENMAYNIKTYLIHAHKLNSEHIKRIHDRYPFHTEHVLNNENIEDSDIPHEVYENEIQNDNMHVYSKKIPHDLLKTANDRIKDNITLNTFLSNENVPEEYINHWLGRLPQHIKSRLYYRQILGRRNLSDNTVDNLVDNSIKYANGDGLDRNSVKAHHIVAAINSPNLSIFISNISKNNKFKADHVNMILNKHDEKPIDNLEYSIPSLIETKGLKQSHLDRLLKVVKNKAEFNKQILHPDYTNSNAISSEYLHKILDDEDMSTEVKRMAVDHPNAQISHITKAMQNPKLHSTISVSKNATPSALRILANSVHHHIRKNVAQNKNAPREIVDMIKEKDNL